MVRTIGWTLLAFFGLAVLAVISLPSADRQQLVEAIGRRSLSHSSAGLGYRDGALVWRETEPVRITVEQLPSLEGRRLGSSWSNGFFQSRMSWFGVTLRSAIAQCLAMPESQVRGDESLDAYWLDVDAAQTHGLFESGFGDWDPVRARILEGLEEHYGFTVTTHLDTVPMRVLRAGPGWSEHLVDGEGSRGKRRDGHVLHEDGVLSVKRMRVASLLAVLRETLGVHRAEDLDTAAWCSFEIPWGGDWDDPEGRDGTEDLRLALARELDLHVEDVMRETTIAEVGGAAQPPLHLR